MKTTISVEAYFAKNPQWKEELETLRELLNSTELEETIKWGMPTYTINNKNVVGLGGFKQHFCLWFFQGSFLEDQKKLLVNAQEGKTRGMRQMRFDTAKDIKKASVKAYVLEAIENQKAGKMIEKMKAKAKKMEPPKELVQLLTNKKIRVAFDKFSVSKQNEFIEYIATAKRESTKLSRLEKIKPMIKAGLGLNDKYR